MVVVVGLIESGRIEDPPVQEIPLPRGVVIAVADESKVEEEVLTSDADRMEHTVGLGTRAPRARDVGQQDPIVSQEIDVLVTDTTDSTRFNGSGNMRTTIDDFAR